ncbi:MAG: hypothetical protein H6772_02905 [Pseudomonadales bacterium]|nr:hypothetical protein [Pseudomonadales bacterium]
MSDKVSVLNEGFFISETFKKAWKIFKQEWITIYAINALPLTIGFIYSILANELNQSSGLFLILYAIYFVVQITVSMGVINALLSVVRGKKVSVDTFTSMLPKSLKYFGAQILMMLIILGGFLLFIIPGIIFSIKYMFTPYFVVDKGLGPIEALKASGKLTDGIKWDLVGFLSAVIILMYSGIMALFVGLLITLPIGTLAFVILYNQLIKRSK